MRSAQLLNQMNKIHGTELYIYPSSFVIHTKLRRQEFALLVWCNFRGSVYFDLPVERISFVCNR